MWIRYVTLDITVPLRNNIHLGKFDGGTGEQGYSDSKETCFLVIFENYRSKLKFNQILKLCLCWALFKQNRNEDKKIYQ